MPLPTNQADQGGATSSFAIRLLLVAVIAVTVGMVAWAAPENSSLYIEAENTQLSGLFSVGDDPSASGGRFATSAKGNGPVNAFSPEDGLLVCFDVVSGGSFQFAASVLGRNEASNSFYMRLDYFDPWVWEFPKGKTYRPYDVTRTSGQTVTVSLEEGQHVIGIFMREPGARIDWIQLRGLSGAQAIACEPSQQATTTTPTTSSGDQKVRGNQSRGGGDQSEATTTTSELTTTSLFDTSTTTSSSTTTIIVEETTTTMAATTTTAPQTTTTSSAPVTTTTAPAPPPRTGGQVVWSASMEGGSLDAWAGFSTSSPGSSETSYSATDDFSHSGQYSLKMTVEDSVSGTGVRARVDKNVAGYSGPENLPTDAYYSAWFYIPEHVSLATGENWNIFQWKQTCQEGGVTTRCLLDWIRLVDLGDRYGFRLRSRIDDDGNWGSSVSNSLAKNTSVTVQAGEWFHIESRRYYDDGMNGRIATWINGQLAWDVGGIRTEMSGSTWEWDTSTAGWRRQWTVNNYNTGGHSPATHSLYVDDAKVALGRQGP